MKQAVEQPKTLSLPALYIQVEENGVNPPKTSEDVPEKFTELFTKGTMSGVGHFPSREVPHELSHHRLAYLAQREAVLYIP